MSITVYLFFRYSSSKLFHLFVLQCILYCTSSNCVKIVIFTLKFDLIIKFDTILGMNAVENLISICEALAL